MGMAASDSDIRLTPQHASGDAEVTNMRFAPVNTISSASAIAQREIAGAQQRFAAVLTADAVALQL